MAEGQSASTQPSSPSFTGPSPVHPLSVAPLVGDLASEQPETAAIDLEGSAKSGSHQAKVRIDAGTVSADSRGAGWVSYRCIGTTPGGLHVLIVMVNGGGSGIFEDVLWVKFVADKVSEEGRDRDRTMMVRVGSFTLGDRDDGNVRLDGAKLFIGKSRYRDADKMLVLE